ncbi:unnamed protein product [[Candida] boidinii]|nr:unnamed protein product [[Candida] boidinii]
MIKKNPQQRQTTNATTNATTITPTPTSAPGISLYQDDSNNITTDFHDGNVPPRNKSPFRDPCNSYIKQIKDQRKPLYIPAVLRAEQNTSPSMHIELSNESNIPPFDVTNNDYNERPKLSTSSSSSSIRTLTSFAPSSIDYWNYLTGGIFSGSSSPTIQNGNNDSKTDIINSNDSKDHNNHTTINSNEEILSNSVDNLYRTIEGPTRKHWKPNNSRFNCYGYKDANFALIGDNNSIEIDDQPQLNDNKKFANKTSTINTTNNEIFNNHKYLCKVCSNCFHKYENFLKDHTTQIEISNNIENTGNNERINNSSGKNTSQLTNNTSNNQQREKNGGRHLNNNNNSGNNEYRSGNNINTTTNNNNANGEKKPQTDESGNSNAIPVDWDWSSF